MMLSTFNLAFARQWLDAAVGNSSNTPPRVTLRRQGWGQLEYGTSLAGAKPCLAGRCFNHGLGTHADSEIVVTLGTGAARFQATVGIDDNPDTRGHCGKSSVVAAAVNTRRPSSTRARCMYSTQWVRKTSGARRLRPKDAVRDEHQHNRRRT